MRINRNRKSRKNLNPNPVTKKKRSDKWLKPITSSVVGRRLVQRRNRRSNQGPTFLRWFPFPVRSAARKFSEVAYPLSLLGRCKQKIRNPSVREGLSVTLDHLPLTDLLDRHGLALTPTATLASTLRHPGTRPAQVHRWKRRRKVLKSLRHRLALFTNLRFRPESAIKSIVNPRWTSIWTTSKSPNSANGRKNFERRNVEPNGKQGRIHPAEAHHPVFPPVRWIAAARREEVPYLLKRAERP